MAMANAILTDTPGRGVAVFSHSLCWQRRPFKGALGDFVGGFLLGNMRPS